MRARGAARRARGGGGGGRQQCALLFARVWVCALLLALPALVAGKANASTSDEPAPAVKFGPNGALLAVERDSEDGGASESRVRVSMANVAPVAHFTLSLGVWAPGESSGGHASRTLGLVGRGKGGSAAEAGKDVGTHSNGLVRSYEASNATAIPAAEQLVWLTTLEVLPEGVLRDGEQPCILWSDKHNWVRVDMNGESVSLAAGDLRPFCSEPAPPPAATCKFGYTRDCNDKCNKAHYVGDGTCDDNSNIRFYCEKFNWDGGDCDGLSGGSALFFFLLPAIIVASLMCVSAVAARFSAFRRARALRRATRTGTLRSTPGAGVELRSTSRARSSPPVRPTDPGADLPPPLERTDSMEDDAPARFLCPITQSIMSDPVVAADGECALARLRVFACRACMCRGARFVAAFPDLTGTHTHSHASRAHQTSSPWVQGTRMSATQSTST